MQGQAAVDSPRAGDNLLEGLGQRDGAQHYPHGARFLLAGHAPLQLKPHP